MRKIDITLNVTPEMSEKASGSKTVLSGHLGTHFDVMDKTFPLEYTERKGFVFDVSKIRDRDIGIDDVDLNLIEEDMFIAFYSGFIEEEGYGRPRYHKEHPQLSDELIEELLKKKISIIGIDFAGVRRGREHTPMDQHCADHGVFIIENLCNLKEVSDAGGRFIARTYPVSFSEMSGLPCRVIAEVEEETKIEHVAMYVNDLERARDFFVNYLNGTSNDGYHNEKTGFRSYFIFFNDGTRLELMNKPSMEDLQKPLNRTGYAHVAFSVGSKEKVDELTGRLKEDGYEVLSGPRTTGDGYYESCILAIENNQIEITV